MLERHELRPQLENLWSRPFRLKDPAVPAATEQDPAGMMATAQSSETAVPAED